MSASIAISVVIRTSNSESPLRRLLKRLKLEPDDEIVIVDTGSIDGTVKVAREAGATVVENREPFNYSRTLNRGFEAARNEWILVVSSHCEPVDPQFLSSYRTILGMKGETPALICGGTFLSRSQMDRASKTIETTREPWLLKRFAGGNANSLYWKDAWRRHPFDESLLTGEDAEWINWLQKERLLCVLAPQTAVLYRHPGGPVYRFRKAYGEVAVGASEDIQAMSIKDLVIGLGQATLRLLLEEQLVKSWIGQMAHQLGPLRPLES